MNKLEFTDRVDEQYSLRKILIIWTLSALPMFLFAFVIAPTVATLTKWPILIVYWMSIIAGLMWQFVLSLCILKYDGHKFNRETLFMRLKYKTPIHPKTGKSSYRLLLWTIPFIVLSIAIQSDMIGLPEVDSYLAPLVKHLPTYDLSSLSKDDYRGQWWIFILLFLTLVFNYFLGEELIYRGILLPKMNGVFGKWDWFFNGVLFGFYHLHKPQVILSTALYFGFVFAFPSKLFQSSWMAAIIHGLEGLFALFLVISVVLG